VVIDTVEIVLASTDHQKISNIAGSPPSGQVRHGNGRLTIEYTESAIAS